MESSTGRITRAMTRASKEPKEVAAKKAKLDILDPLKATPFDVHDFIFQHLTGREVLKFSRVSRSWSEEMKDSKKCGDKLMLRFSGFSGHPQISKGEIPPKRKFAGIRLEDGAERRLPEIINFLKQGYPWKKVELKEKFATGEDLKSFMKAIAPTVEDLEIKYLAVREYEEPGIAMATEGQRIGMSFPKLKRLHIKDLRKRVLEFILRDIADSCKTLESLHLSNHFYNNSMYHMEVSKIIVHKILENNKNLNELRLLNIHFDLQDTLDLFSREAVQSYRFHLKSLKLDCSGLKDVDDSFLESQSQNLEELKLPCDVQVNTLKIILKMPRLKMLKIPCIKKKDEALSSDEDDDEEDGVLSSDKDDGAWKYVELPKHTSIEDFECEAFAGLNINIKNKLLSSMPNLTSFSCNYFTMEVLESLNLHSNQIKRLSVKNWTNDLGAEHLGNQEYFPNIEELRCERERAVSCELKKKIKEKPKDRLTPFEKLFLELRDNRQAKPAPACDTDFINYRF